MTNGIVPGEHRGFLTRIYPHCLESVAGCVIQATGRTDFEDGPRIGNQSEARNSLQRVRTIPENN